MVSCWLKKGERPTELTKLNLKTFSQSNIPQLNAFPPACSSVCCVWSRRWMCASALIVAFGSHQTTHSADQLTEQIGQHWKRGTFEKVNSFLWLDVQSSSLVDRQLATGRIQTSFSFFLQLQLPSPRSINSVLEIKQSNAGRPTDFTHLLKCCVSFPLLSYSSWTWTRHPSK